jgi:hypothetical protein
MTTAAWASIEPALPAPHGALARCKVTTFCQNLCRLSTPPAVNWSSDAFDRDFQAASK